LDIPFIRFAFPVLILYAFWWILVANPWVDDTAGDDTTSPNALSTAATRELLEESRALIQSNRLEEALVPLKKLHAAYPEDQIYSQQMAETYERLSMFREAAESWENYLEYSPTPIEACPQIAFAYQKQGKRREALKAFERCWSIDEQNVDSIVSYAHALEMEGQFGRAKELYQKGVRLAPHYPDLAVGLARVQARMGEAAAARPRIDAVLREHPDDADALLAAGLVYWKLGEIPTAIRYLERGRRIAPAYRDIGTILAQVRREARTQ
jgi:tetratricopeptide (TPR) repeat protein